jgi:hypothetical protein
MTAGDVDALQSFSHQWWGSLLLTAFRRRTELGPIIQFSVRTHELGESLSIGGLFAGVGTVSVHFRTLHWLAAIVAFPEEMFGAG